MKLSTGCQYAEFHNYLLGPFRNYEEKNVLLIRLLTPFSQHFIFFVTYEWVQWTRVFVPSMLLHAIVM